MFSGNARPDTSPKCYLLFSIHTILCLLTIRSAFIQTHFLFYDIILLSYLRKEVKPMSNSPPKGGSAGKGSSTSGPIYKGGTRGPGQRPTKPPK